MQLWQLSELGSTFQSLGNGPSAISTKSVGSWQLVVRSWQLVAGSCLIQTGFGGVSESQAILCAVGGRESKAHRIALLFFQSAGSWPLPVTNWALGWAQVTLPMLGLDAERANHISCGKSLYLRQGGGAVEASHITYAGFRDGGEK